MGANVGVFICECACSHTYLHTQTWNPQKESEVGRKVSVSTACVSHQNFRKWLKMHISVFCFLSTLRDKWFFGNLLVQCNPENQLVPKENKLQMVPKICACFADVCDDEGSGKDFNFLLWFSYHCYFFWVQKQVCAWLSMWAINNMLIQKSISRTVWPRVANCFGAAVRKHIRKQTTCPMCCANEN